MPVLRLPPRARIIYLPGDNGRSHEIVLKRRAIGAALAVLGLVVLAIATFLSTYAVLLIRSAQLSRVQQQLKAANEQLEAVRSINRELEQSRRLQDQLLDVLGVSPARAPQAGHPIGAGAAGAFQDAGLLTAPPPDRWPLGGYVTREFAPPGAGDGDARAGHEGVDIVAPLDTPILAAGKGRVTAAGWDNFLGNYVEITHGLGYVTVYGHCSRLAAREGDRVDRGQEIAFLGGTGQASAPHLHFEVWKDGVAIDPRLVIAKDPPR